MRETGRGGFQEELIDDLERLFPEAIILRGNSATRRGVTDLIVLNGDRWAGLESKRSENAKRQPLQDYYVDRMNAMSYASFVSPENKEQVLNELQQSLKPSRASLDAQREQVSLDQLRTEEVRRLVSEIDGGPKRQRIARAGKKLDRYESEAPEDAKND